MSTKVGVITVPIGEAAYGKLELAIMDWLERKQQITITHVAQSSTDEHVIVTIFYSEGARMFDEFQQAALDHPLVQAIWQGIAGQSRKTAEQHQE